MDYKKAYLTMFNASSNALFYLEKQSPATAAWVLVQAQRAAEELIISQPSEEDEVMEEKAPVQ